MTRLNGPGPLPPHPARSRARRAAPTYLAGLLTLFLAAGCDDVQEPLATDVTSAESRGTPSQGPQAQPSLDLRVVAGGGDDTSDGIPATDAELSAVEGVDARPNGSLVLADTYNNRIRAVDNRGRIRTVAGTGEFGSDGDGGKALEAQFSFPFDVAVMPRGDIYIADTYNHRIRRIDRDGKIQTVAGTGEPGSEGAEGPATEAQLQFPFGVDVSPDGRVLISDTFNHRIVTIDDNGHLEVLAGTGERGHSGDGGPAVEAHVALPYTASWGQGGEIFIADTGNDRIRSIDGDGTISTVAGTGERGFSSEGEPAEEADLNAPHTLAVDASGRIVIGDTGNNRLREIRPDGSLVTIAGNGEFGSALDGSTATEAPLQFRSGLVSPRPGILVLAEYAGARVVELK